MKAARKSGQYERAHGWEWIGRSLRDVIDWSALRRAGSSLSEPAVAVRAAREAVKTEKAGALVQLVSDAARVQTRAGTQAALEGLKLAQGPEVDRLVSPSSPRRRPARLARSSSWLGRGAILLTIGSFNLALWIVGAIATLFGFVSPRRKPASSG